MLKKLLAIAMIGTAMTASAEVPMEFRDGTLNSIDLGGHFFHSYDATTGVTTFKSINENTTKAEIAEFMGIPESDIEGIADVTAGPRYVRTKKPVGGTWKSLGLDENHTYVAFDYKVNKANANAFIYWQEGLPYDDTNPSAAGITLSVAEEWQTIFFTTTPAPGWTDMENNGYMWLVFNSWADSKDEIVFEVKNLRFLTSEEVAAQYVPSASGTEITYSPANPDIVKDEDDWGEPFWRVSGPNPIFFCNSFSMPHPQDHCILSFDSKCDQPARMVVYIDPKSKWQDFQPTGILQLEVYEGDIMNPDAEWEHHEINLGKDKNWKNMGFAKEMGSNDRLAIQFAPSVVDGMIYLRNMKLIADPAGIQGVGADEDSEVVSSQYFDLQGRQLKAAPESGLYLRRDIRANGTSATVKAIR